APGDAGGAAVNPAESTGGRQIGDSTPAGPHGTPAHLEGGRRFRVGECGGLRRLQSGQPEAGREQVVTLAMGAHPLVLENRLLEGPALHRRRTGLGGGPVRGAGGKDQRGRNGSEPVQAALAEDGVRIVAHGTPTLVLRSRNASSTRGGRHRTFVRHRQPGALCYGAVAPTDRAAMTDTFLTGRTALVTGRTSGIGLGIAKCLAAAGARVAVTGLGSPRQIEAALTEVRDAGAAEVRHFIADLRDPAALARLVDEASAWGPIDVLVNNAG